MTSIQIVCDSSFSRSCCHYCWYCGLVAARPAVGAGHARHERRHAREGACQCLPALLPPLLPPAHPEKSAALAPSTGQPEDGCMPPSAHAARRLAYPSGFAVRVRAGHATRSAPQRGERDDCGGTQLAVVSCRRRMPTAHADGHIPVQLQRTAQLAAPPRGRRVG